MPAMLFCDNKKTLSYDQVITPKLWLDSWSFLTRLWES